MEYLNDLKYLIIGALAVSLAEYLFNYNLIALAVEKIGGLFKSSPKK